MRHLDYQGFEFNDVNVNRKLKIILIYAYFVAQQCQQCEMNDQNHVTQTKKR